MAKSALSESPEFKLAQSGTTEDFSVIPVTAKHNLHRLDNFYQAEEATVPLDGLDESIRGRLRFPELDWIAGPADASNIRSGKNGQPALWKWGFDISKGELIGHVEEGITSECSMF